MNLNPILIVIVRPSAYIHSEAFRESVELLHSFLVAKLFIVEIQEISPGDINTLEPLRPKIIFGAHLDAEIRPSENHVIVNLEQLSSASLAGSYLSLLKNSWFLDYSTSHTDGLLASNKDRCLGFLGLTGQQLAGRNSLSASKTEELLFFGSVTNRRETAIKKLREEGLPVRIISGIYGPELWPWIARCKAVLNIHAYDCDTPFESVRLSALLSNAIPIISEQSIMNPWDRWLIDSGLPFFSFENCTSTTITSLQSSAEVSAQLIAKKTKEQDSTYRLIRLAEWCGEVSSKSEVKCPVRPWGLKIEGLHAGCGRKKIPTMINLDINPSLEPDVSHNICDPSIVNTQYFDVSRNQTIELGRSSLSTIVSDCTFEHLQDISSAMKNCRDLLVPGGMLYLKVPYDLSFGAWQDPTHKHPFNEKSFLYFYDWAWYLGWSEWGLKTLNIRPVLSDSGRRLREQGKSIDELACIPRAIDSLEVLMAKRLLPPARVLATAESNSDNKADQRRDQLIKNYQIKSLYKPSHAIATLLFDSNPDLWQTPAWLQRLKSCDSLSSAPRGLLPSVSVVTPTTSARLSFLANCCIQILQQTYPLNLIEWLIVPDEMSIDLQRLVDAANGIIDIRIVLPSHLPATIGAKRNLCLAHAQNEIIVHFDDDDFYFPNRIFAAVDALLQGANPFSYAGCNELPIYFLATEDLWLSTPSSNMACAGSFAYSRELASRTFFDDKVSNGEEFSFTRNYTLPLLKIEPLDCMVCLAHSNNTFDKNNLRRAGESSWIKKTSLKKSDEIPYLCANETFLRLRDIASDRLALPQVIDILSAEAKAISIVGSIDKWTQPLRNLLNFDSK